MANNFNSVIDSSLAMYKESFAVLQKTTEKVDERNRTLQLQIESIQQEMAQNIAAKERALRAMKRLKQIID